MKFKIFNSVLNLAHLGVKGLSPGVVGSSCDVSCYWTSSHCSGIDPEKTTMQEVYTKFGLDANTASFTGHALALQVNDE